MKSEDSEKDPSQYQPGFFNPAPGGLQRKAGMQKTVSKKALRLIANLPSGVP
jgi:hypothetical protein